MRLHGHRTASRQLQFDQRTYGCDPAGIETHNRFAAMSRFCPQCSRTSEESFQHCSIHLVALWQRVPKRCLTCVAEIERGEFCSDCQQRMAMQFLTHQPILPSPTGQGEPKV